MYILYALPHALHYVKVCVVIFHCHLHRQWSQKFISGYWQIDCFIVHIHVSVPVYVEHYQWSLHVVLLYCRFWYFYCYQCFVVGVKTHRGITSYFILPHCKCVWVALLWACNPHTRIVFQSTVHIFIFALCVRLFLLFVKFTFTLGLEGPGPGDYTPILQNAGPSVSTCVYMHVCIIWSKTIHVPYTRGIMLFMWKVTCVWFARSMYIIYALTWSM